MDGILDASKYMHSPAHKAVLSHDYVGLNRILASLPRLSDPSEINSEAASIAEEEKADRISAVIDRRDVPDRETPLYLAVRLGDTAAAEMLMAAGADWSLQNEQGWSALQEAICMGDENIAKIIVRHHKPSAWAKWCRRLPRVVATMRRMRDFYMEFTFHFESSVIPFLSRIAPSDTYKMWKRGSNLRADMTLAGFDGLKIQRSDQSVLFLGDGSEDGRVPAGSLCMVTHKHKEIMDTLHGAGSVATEADVEEEVSAMFKTNIFRPGIDVTRAVLLPQLTWRRQAKIEMVGPWKTNVYDMHNVVVSMKSRRVPSAVTDDESSASENGDEIESEECDDGVLTEEEEKQLGVPLGHNSMDVNDSSSLPDGSIGCHNSCIGQREIPVEDMALTSGGNNEEKQDKRRWFSLRSGCHNKKQELKKGLPPHGLISADENVNNQNKHGRHEGALRCEGIRRGRDGNLKRSVKDQKQQKDKNNNENEYKKALRPILWLSSDFPLQTEELLPLLDILANKVKAIRRLREVLTTKLPAGTFPVKVAIPVVPTIKVLVTFTKYEELQPEEEFYTPLSSPESKNPAWQPSSSSWLQWIKVPYYNQNYSAMSGLSNHVEDVKDPFVIPPDYTWITPEEKRKKMQEKRAKKKIS